MAEIYNNEELQARAEAEAFREPKFEAQKKKAIVKTGVPIIPKKDRIVIIQNEFKQRSVIYIPDKAQQLPTTGVVVAIGPDVEEDFVEIDEPIVFAQYGGVPLNIVDDKGKETKYLSLRPDEIAGTLVIIEEEPKNEDNNRNNLTPGPAVSDGR